MKESEIKKQERRIKSRERKYESKRFSELSSSERDLVVREIEDEGIDKKDLRTFKYGFGNVKTDKMISILVPRRRTRQDNVKITHLESSISERGFDPEHPVLLIEMGWTKLDVLGGNHRVQAARNLQEKGMMPKNRGLPSIILFPGDE